LELGIFAGVSLLFPFEGKSETMISAGGGVRLAFECPDSRLASESPSY
jgi:hypothetical protein